MSRRGLEVWRIDGDPAPLGRDNMLDPIGNLVRCLISYLFYNQSHISNKIMIPTRVCSLPSAYELNASGFKMWIHMTSLQC